MDLTTMTYEVRDGVAHVRFTRPEGANAVNPAFSADLRAVMVAIEFDAAVKAVSVTAEGKVFCAGGDLKLFYEAGPDVPSLAADMLVDFHGAIYKMNSIPKPFVAGVRGAAGGAGLGKNRQYWGHAAQGVLPCIKRRAPRPDELPRFVFSQDASIA